MLEGGATLETVRELMGHCSVTVAESSVRYRLAPKANAVERNILMHFMKVSASGDAYLGSMLALGEIDVADFARTIRATTLVGASDADSAIPLSASRELASLIPGARFELFSGASHRGKRGRAEAHATGFRLPGRRGTGRAVGRPPPSSRLTEAKATPSSSLLRSNLRKWFRGGSNRSRVRIEHASRPRTGRATGELRGYAAGDRRTEAARGS